MGELVYVAGKHKWKKTSGILSGTFPANHHVFIKQWHGWENGSETLGHCALKSHSKNNCISQRVKTERRQICASSL